MKRYIILIIVLLFVVGCLQLPQTQDTDSSDYLEEPLKKTITTEGKDKVTITENPTIVYVNDAEDEMELKPTGKSYENTKGGYTLIFDDYTFEKKTDTYGQLKDITFIIKNDQGSATIIPRLMILVTDKENSKFTINKDIDLSEWLSDQDSIKRTVIVDLGIGEINNKKEMKLVLSKGFYGDIVNTVSFDVNLAEDLSLG